MQFGLLNRHHTAYVSVLDKCHYNQLYLDKMESFQHMPLEEDILMFVCSVLIMLSLGWYSKIFDQCEGSLTTSKES